MYTGLLQRCSADDTVNSRRYLEAIKQHVVGTLVAFPAVGVGYD